MTIFTKSSLSLAKWTALSQNLIPRDKWVKIIQHTAKLLPYNCNNLNSHYSSISVLMKLVAGIPFANIILLSCFLPFPSYCTSLPTSYSHPLPSSPLTSSPLFSSVRLSLLLFHSPLFSSLSFTAYSILSNLYFPLLPSPLVSSPLLSYRIFSSAVLTPPPC
jgi:hypothetical protein